MGVERVTMVQLAADVVFVAVAGCTLFNVYSVVSMRAGGRVTRLDVRSAVWCAVVALLGVALLVFALAG